jgi:hypothetical protein
VRGLYGLDRLCSQCLVNVASSGRRTSHGHLQASEDDPSVYWLAIEGDVTVWLEILDERYAIRIVKIE